MDTSAGHDGGVMEKAGKSSLANSAVARSGCTEWAIWSCVFCIEIEFFLAHAADNKGWEMGSARVGIRERS
jgi:hypothetical protein